MTVYSLRLAWTPDGHRRVLECSCGAQMLAEAAVRHLLEHPVTVWSVE